MRRRYVQLANGLFVHMVQKNGAGREIPSKVLAHWNDKFGNLLTILLAYVVPLLLSLSSQYAVADACNLNANNECLLHQMHSGSR